MLRDLKWFDAALPTSNLAERVARLLRGSTADALRELLGASDDLSADAKRAALAEPLCAPSAGLRSVPRRLAPRIGAGMMQARVGQIGFKCNE